VEETSCSEDDAIRALIQTSCDIEEAISLVKNNLVDQNIHPNVVIDNDDLRYKQIEDDFEIRSNAVIFCIMDTSGSMSIDKKYKVRSFLFWFVEFLKKTYENVQIRFISHSTDANLVDEDDFFHIGSDGGTLGKPAIDLAAYTLATEYPEEAWNRYCILTSDGEYWDVDDTIASIKSLLKAGLNMFMYTQVTDGDYDYGESLLDSMKKEFSFNNTYAKINKSRFYKNTSDRVYMCNIQDKSDIWDALKFFLFEKDAKNGSR
jgi:uncharacterized sporulation protein YeaH/YhbH (DUF444 family)